MIWDILLLVREKGRILVSASFFLVQLVIINMDVFAEKVANIAANFFEESEGDTTAAISQRILDALRSSSCFDAFAKSGEADSVSALIIAEQRAAIGTPSKIVCSNLLTAFLDREQGVADFTSCVALIHRSVPAAAQAAPSPQFATSPAAATEAVTAAASPPSSPTSRAARSKVISIRECHFQTVSPSGTVEDLLDVLRDVYAPLCDAVGGSAKISTQVHELINAIHGQKSKLADFRAIEHVPNEITQLASQNPTADAAAILAALGPKALQHDFINRTQDLRVKCTSVLETDIFNHDVLSVAEESLYWQEAERWLENVTKQLQSREWQVASRVLERRMGKVHVDRYEQHKKMVSEYVRFVSGIPSDSIAKASDADLDKEVALTFSKLSEVSKTVYPLSRALQLGEIIVEQVCDRLVDSLQKKELLQGSTFDDAVRGFETMQPIKATLQQLQSNMIQLSDLRTLGARYAKSGVTRDDYQPHHHLVRLQKRIQLLQALLGDFSKLHKTVRATFPSSSGENKLLSHLEGALDVFRVATTGLLWNFSDSATVSFKQAVSTYEKQLADIEDNIAAVVKNKLSTASSATEMFRVHSQFHDMLYLQRVSAVVNQFQTHLLTLVDDGLRDTRQRYFDKAIAREAIRVAASKGVSQLVAKMMWQMSIVHRVTTLLEHRDRVSQLGWGKLMQLRNVKGRWTLNEQLAAFFGVSLPELEIEDRKYNAEAFGTAYAIAFLHLIYHDQQKDWGDKIEEVSRSLESQVLTNAKNRLESIGVGARHAYNLQVMSEHRQFMNVVLQQLDKDMEAWTTEARRVNVETSDIFRDGVIVGPVIAVAHSQDKSKREYLKVTIPENAATLIADERELNVMGMFKLYLDTASQAYTARNLQIAAVRQYIDGVREHYSVAFSIASLLSKYYNAVRECGTEVAILLETENNKLQQTFLDGFSVHWSMKKDNTSDRPISTNAKGYTTELAKVLFSFLEKVNEVKGNVGRLREAVTRLETCPLSSKDFSHWMGVIQQQVNDLTVLSSPDNVSFWLQQAQPEIDRVLTQHLAKIIQRWTVEFRYLDPAELERAQKAETRIDRRIDI